MKSGGGVGNLTWPKANDPHRFAIYAADMAETFAECDSVQEANYDRRRNHPAEDA